MDPRMENGFEFLPAFVRSENDGGQSRTVKTTVVPQDSPPEASENLIESVRTGADHFARYIIGIQQWDTARSQKNPCRRLSGTDATGDSPTDHDRKGTAAPWGGRSLNHLVRTR